MISFGCHRCAKTVERASDNPIGRSESCPHCGSDLRCCLNCRHYDRNAHRECRENIPELVREKDRGNFCDFFQVRAGAAAAGAGGGPSREDLLKKAMDLFKK